MELPANLTFVNCHPKEEDLSEILLSDFRSSPKKLSPKFLYDEMGSELFAQICEQPEYYPPETEIQILEDNASEIAERVGCETALIEYGSGSSRKIRALLSFVRPQAYLPVDISKDYLIGNAVQLAEDYRDLKIMAICADFTQPFTLPEATQGLRRVVYFSGSTIGNFEPNKANRILEQIHAQVGKGGALLIAVDIKKDPSILEAAYNDANGVTAQFEKNLLVRLNREFRANFDLDQFEYEGVYNEEIGRVEMSLRSLRAQSVSVMGERVNFAYNERILTEYSYKYSVEEFQQIARDIGFEPLSVYTDSQNLFSVHLLQVA